MALIKMVVHLVTLFIGVMNGRTRADNQITRIVNGRNALEGEFPYQAQFGYSNHPGLLCGATVIDKYHLLTAAHCIERDLLDSGVVSVGSIYLSSLTNPKDKLYEIDHYYISTLFNANLLLMDVALLRIKGGFKFDETVKPIPLRTEPIKKGLCIATGWGVTMPLVRQESQKTREERASNILKTVDIPLVELEECQRRLDPFGILLLPTMLCAGWIDGEKDACKGDSGGPLVCDGQLTGIISFGIGCARPLLPGVYTDVASINSWIKGTLEKSYEDSGLKESASQ